MSVKIKYKGPASVFIKGKAFPFRKLKKEAQEAVEKAAKGMLQEIVAATPSGKGKARSGWRLVRQSSGSNISIAIKNSVKYINVLEYGGYPVRAISRSKAQRGAIVRGKGYVGGNFDPGPRTQPSSSTDPLMLKPSNVSSEAPKGMVRNTIKNRKEQARGGVAKAVMGTLKKLFGGK